MKIVTVCGLGVGSSLILKMTVETALKKIRKKANVEHWDMGTIKGVKADIIITTTNFRKQFADNENVIFIENIVDANEVQKKLEEYLEKIGG